MLLSSKKTLNRFFDFGLLTRIHDLDKQSDFGLCVTKIFEPTNDPKSSIPESGKGRGESALSAGTMGAAASTIKLALCNCVPRFRN